MNSVDFCYWMQGFFELSETEEITPKQVGIIKEHLNLVFLHEIDPLRNEETTTPSNVLDQAHNSGHSNDPLVRC